MSASAQRAYRQRCKAGVRMLTIPVTEAHEQGLVDAKLLSPLTDDRDQVIAAVVKLLDMLVDGEVP